MSSEEVGMADLMAPSVLLSVAGLCALSTASPLLFASAGLSEGDEMGPDGACVLFRWGVATDGLGEA